MMVTEDHAGALPAFFRQQLAETAFPLSAMNPKGKAAVMVPSTLSDTTCGRDIVKLSPLLPAHAKHSIHNCFQARRRLLLV
jgi:hypothetical protein